MGRDASPDPLAVNQFCWEVHKALRAYPNTYFLVGPRGCQAQGAGCHTLASPRKGAAPLHIGAFLRPQHGF